MLGVEFVVQVLLLQRLEDLGALHFLALNGFLDNGILIDGFLLAWIRNTRHLLPPRPTFSVV